MALTDSENNGFYMPVAPAYGGGFGNGNNNGFGGDWAWIILLLLLGWGNNGNCNGFGGGYGNNLYPWMNQANLTSDGFQNQLMNDNITSIRDGVHSLSTQLCNCCSDTQMALANGFAGIEQGANSRAMANMQQLYGLQSQFADCCCENRLGIADLKYTVATENCADRTQSIQNTRDIIEAGNRNSQAILDKLCQLELDGIKGDLAQAQRDNASLQNQLNMATMRESQTAQTAQILAGQANEIDGVYNRLKNCPVPSMPVYGNTPIFTCNGNNTCGCGNNF